ncbi:RNA polymerase sigma factor [Sphaerisporangium sp. NPDC051017]|uniref:RNA polymerase sigma factor n=1 Tax=unclassified Sphaerisporangium TaxID=2630420 RepID=UPI003409A482
MTTELTDAALIEKSLWSPEVFTEVFARYADQVHRYLARRAGPDVADDLMSDTFLVAFEQRHRFSGERSPTGALPWLLGIATTLLRSHGRAEARRWKALAQTRSDLALAEPSPADQVAERVDAGAVVRSVVHTLAAMTEGDRDALLLYAWADLKYEEIAATLEIPVGTVRSRIHRARAQLRSAITSTPLEGRPAR